MNTALQLASDFIERAGNHAFGQEINEEYVLRWERLKLSGTPIATLGIADLSREDIGVLSLDAWLWLGSTLGVDDPEYPAPFVDALFKSTDDPIQRLRVADMSLRHPALAQRYAQLGEPQSLDECPQSWVKSWLLALTRQQEPMEGGIEEMAVLLLQVGNHPALRLLRALRRTRTDMVDGVIRTMRGISEDNFADFINRLRL